MHYDWLWEEMKKYKHVSEIAELLNEHSILQKILYCLQNKFPVNVSIVSFLQNKYKNELEIVRKMKKVKINYDNLEYIDKVNQLDKDLSYVALNKLFQGKANDLLEKCINVNNDTVSDVIKEVFTYLANNNPYVNA